MKILQITRTHSQDCGLALFAGNLQIQMEDAGVKVITAETPPRDFHPDLALD